MLNVETNDVIDLFTDIREVLESLSIDASPEVIATLVLAHVQQGCLLVLTNAVESLDTEVSRVREALDGVGRQISLN